MTTDRTTAVTSPAAANAQGGVRHGIDLVRALRAGADFAFAGRAFLWGHGAAGSEGAAHVAALFEEEFRIALAQSGASDIAALRATGASSPG